MHADLVAGDRAGTGHPRPGLLVRRNDRGDTTGFAGVMAFAGVECTLTNTRQACDITQSGLMRRANVLVDGGSVAVGEVSGNAALTISGATGGRHARFRDPAVYGDPRHAGPTLWSSGRLVLDRIQHGCRGRHQATVLWRAHCHFHHQGRASYVSDAAPDVGLVSTLSAGEIRGLRSTGRRSALCGNLAARCIPMEMAAIRFSE